jgi:UDP-N-acetylglucosamine 2-epimerase (hydrolysing)
MAKTILGFSDFVNGISPDLIVVHGDRVEALAGATVGAFNNIIVAHVEGGEVSGTIDDLIRHAASKLSHAHFVANEAAAQRLRQLGEAESSIFIIGSPDIDVMNSTSLPTIDDMKTHYEIEFSEYAILIFHPVTTELEELGKKIDVITQFLKKSSHNFIIIYPNNDPGSRQILAAYESLRGCKNIKIFPSMRFEYFLTLLKNARFIIGNSSSGIREAPHFCIPAVNLGTRQNRRVSNRMVINSDITEQAIIASIEAALSVPRVQISGFGDGNSSTMFYKSLSDPRFWDLSVQKKFVDLGDR